MVLGRVLTFTSVVVVLFTGLVFNSFWSLYSLFRIPLCELKDEKFCIRPYFGQDEKLDVSWLSSLLAKYNSLLAKSFIKRVYLNFL